MRRKRLIALVNYLRQPPGAIIAGDAKSSPHAIIRFFDYLCQVGTPNYFRPPDRGLGGVPLSLGGLGAVLHELLTGRLPSRR